MDSIFDKYRSKYLSKRLIIALDFVLSSLASVIVFICFKLSFEALPFSLRFMVLYVVAGLVSFAIGDLIVKPYRNAIRHMTVIDLVRFAIAILVKVVPLLLVSAALGQLSAQGVLFLVLDFFVTFFALAGCRGLMIIVYSALLRNKNKDESLTNVMIFGTGSKAVSLVTRLNTSRQYCVKGFISSTEVNKGLILCDKEVLYFGEYTDFELYAKENGIEAVLFAHESDVRAESDGLVRFCQLKGIKVLIAPSVNEVTGKMAHVGIREVRIEDLLGRDEIKLDTKRVEENFSGKVVMVTGAAGSIGSELVRQLADFGVRRLILFDNAETPLHNLRLELEERFPQLDFVPVVGDVRVDSRLDYVFRTWKPQVVFHAAAYKHVPLMEENPCEAVLVNVAGSRYVADKCIEYGVEKMVMISTDKAVNPTNIMGCTKRLAEIYVQSLGMAEESGEVKGTTKFVTTRFGNVLGSNGSVIPRFRKQIHDGGPVTVTHPEITRYFMTIPEACRLVLEAGTLSESNKIFVFDMGKPVKIDTMARRMIELAGLQPDKDIMIEYVGLRPGEKLYEEVLAKAENNAPTENGRIFVADVRKYSYEKAREGNLALEKLSRECNISDMVRLMKEIVPEFKSKNSRFEEFDVK